MALFDSSAVEVTGNRMRERRSDTQQRDPGQESNPGLLQSLGTWDASLPTELNGALSLIYSPKLQSEALSNIST